MERVTDFHDLIVWQKAHRLFLDAVKDVEQFPRKIASRIVTDQLLRAVGSISANIAEGFGRRKGKEYLHYLIISRGSTTESLNWYEKVKDLGWMDNQVYDLREKNCQELLKMLNKMVGQEFHKLP